MIQKTKNRLSVFLKDNRKKSMGKILKESIHLWILKKEVPFYYFKYLYRKEVHNYLDYISTKEASKIQHSANFHKIEYTTIISNKLIFSVYCKRNNLPVPELKSYNFNSNFFFENNVYKIKTKNDLISFYELVFSKNKDSCLFIKPLSLYGGKGCYKIRKEHLADDINKCFQYVVSDSCVHEEFVKQHPKINKIHPKCVNTIRVETFIDKEGKTHILSAFMRFGVGDSFVDNAHSGGFYVGINLQNGILNKIGHQYMEYGGAHYIAHPDNGYVFEGFSIPYFQELKDVVFKAVDFIPDRYIGWDIAIGENGPIIIEANEYPSIFMADIAYGGYLNHPLYKDILEEAKNSEHFSA
ncbi:sugar-transfer associated ATP-grasp domain-containing protein [Cellulophaga fucicola]|uniref:Sugar-transfer associated ATP-grasp n=1 Tax=Cellulophaga fucicola TaxID=76595 RepID=A0A1K1LX40_9FLAO|nr:sugar-transfer associated ATP-grasp domain-containing protein [Cellulophaga fucicola]SFW15411.1 Sugar-transfer associated ATP-grasp [Cellulophaga fucicola]